MDNFDIPAGLGVSGAVLSDKKLELACPQLSIYLFTTQRNYIRSVRKTLCYLIWINKRLQKYSATDQFTLTISIYQNGFTKVTCNNS